MDINARQLDALDFNFLDQSETYQYSVDQLARAKANAAIMTKLGTEVAAWELATQIFDTTYRKSSTALQTKVVEDLDKERDSILTGFNGTVSNAMKSPIAAQKQAATELQEPIKRYDISTVGEYQQQTMRTDQMCQDLLANYATQLATLGLTAWVEALQAKNAEFNAAMIARTNDQAGYVKSELTQLRSQMIAAYRAFVKMLNVVLIYEGDTAYATTVDQMNAEVRHYKQIIARKGANVSSGSSNTPGSSSTNTNSGQNNQGNQSGQNTQTGDNTGNNGQQTGDNTGNTGQQTGDNTGNTGNDNPDNPGGDNGNDNPGGDINDGGLDD